MEKILMDPDQLNIPTDDDGSSESGDPDSLANGFLKNVDPNDLAYVEKYVKDWDAGVTKKFQDIHKQYEPYKNLGVPPENLKYALDITQSLDTDPIAFYKAVRQGLIEMYGDDFDAESQPPAPSTVPEYEGIPKEFLNEFQELKSKLGQFEEFQQSLTQQQAEQQEMAMLDDTLKAMHTKHGDFDDDWVLIQLANGKSPDDAVAAYNKFVEGIVSSRTKKPAPPVLGGPGGIPTGQVDKSKIKTSGDRKALLAQILEQAQQS
jgi:hypothetical protein